ncbi:MAG: hypothetical protein LBL15_00365 [Oscillospiraceae bacterium]|jgi:hypothetical protein|nr:hypothetical protein [Oscillospiraceae bacterium]
MGFIQQSFDTKKLARVLRKRPGDPDWKVRYTGGILPSALTPAMYRVCMQILRRNKIVISEVDFDEIGDGDIDDLESILEDNPSHALFTLSELFREFVPSAADKSVFI